MNSKRLSYPDICKFIAIFLVTWSHCAQCISGETWTNFLGGGTLDIAINMPLFMLMSGWFINPDKIRESKVMDFIGAKFKRLMIPSITWYLVSSLFLLQLPGFGILTFYWYLNALFVCLCVIMLSTKVFKNNIVCCTTSIFVVLLSPYSDISNINFMMPFLWAGYGLRKILRTKFAIPIVIGCTLLGSVMCLYWNPAYTVYVCPFISLNLNYDMIMVYIYRFSIGFTISSVIIFLIMKTENSIIGKLAPLGSYSLVIYTSSLALLGPISICLSIIDFNTNAYGLIDVLSLCLCLIIIFATIKFCDFCRKNRMLSFFFLGE